MPVGEKDMCATQKIGVAQGHSLLEKRNGKMTKRNGLGDRSQMTTSFHLPVCSHWFSWVSWLSYYSALLIGTIRGLTRKEGFAEKFPINTCQS